MREWHRLVRDHMREIKCSESGQSVRGDRTGKVVARVAAVSVAMQEGPRNENATTVAEPARAQSASTS
jgi:hypothetical protein